MSALTWGLIAKELRAFASQTLEIPYDLQQITFIFAGVSPVTLHLPPASWQGTLPADTPKVVEDDGTLRSKILELLRKVDKPLKGASIAKKLGRDYDSYLKETLSEMRRGGAVIHANGGYWLQGRSLPGLAAEEGDGEG